MSRTRPLQRSQGGRDETDWVVILFRTLVGGFLTFRALQFPLGFLQRPQWFYSILALLLALNLVALICFRLNRSYRPVWLVSDLGWIGLWLWGTGREAPDYFPLTYFIAVVSGMWYRVVGGVLAASLASLIYLWVLTVAPDLPPDAFHNALVSDVPFLFLAALLVGYLADARQREHEERLEAQQIAEQYRMDMVMSQRLRQVLVPAEPPIMDSLEIGIFTRTGRGQIGGDFHDFIALSPSRLVVVIGDVAGKGFDPQVCVALLKFAFKAQLNLSGSPGEVMSRLNNSVLDDLLPGDRFATFFFAEIELNEGKLSFCNAGHVPPLLVRLREKQVDALTNRGVPLGVLADFRYEGADATLAPGDVLVLYTDGVTSARNIYGKEFGLERLRRLLASIPDAPPQQMAQQIAGAVDQFEARGTGDDLTVVVVKRKG